MLRFDIENCINKNKLKLSQNSVSKEYNSHNNVVQ